MDKLVYFIEIASLFEENYTGISNVNFHVVKYFFSNYLQQTCFFHLKKVVKKEIIKDLLQKKTGKGLKQLHDNGEMYEEQVEELVKSSQNSNILTVGIFTRTKVIIYGEERAVYANFFDYEAQIIYDLTTIMMPEFHQVTTNSLHQKSFLNDLESDDLCICISESTKEDLIDYLDFPTDKCLVSYVGCDQIIYDSEPYKDVLSKYRVEKFILVLGTVEPRKNTQFIINLLEECTDILNEYKFIFLGKDGWGKTFKDQISQANIDSRLKEDRIQHFGFVSDEERNILLMTAEFMIYPSIYEGFGLPVLEALNAGCPVLASFSSSIPEIGKDTVYYFDPYCKESFIQSFNIIKTEIDQNRAIIRENGIQVSKKYTWEAFNKRIVDRIHEDIKK